jgi:hypothetical protein
MATNKRNATEPLLTVTKKSRPSLPASAKPINATATYPWDSHQDDIIVNSIEQVAGGGKRRRGVKHYLHMLDVQQNYEHICTSPDDEHKDDPSEQDLSDLDEEETLWDSLLDPNIDYTVLPSPPAARSDYDDTIHAAKTCSTAACLAIIRVAQKNMPFLDLRSAISHLPNLGPKDFLPELPEGTFVGDIPHDKKRDDEEIRILLLPHFYSDKRHALGYYVLGPDPVVPKRRWMRTALFTPCTTGDLEDWDLVADVDDNVKLREQVVGAREGKWLDLNVVEDYEEWSLAYRIVGTIWQNRMNLTMGMCEDGTRWKG